MASKIMNCLWFEKGEARKAAEFYASVFPNSRVGPAWPHPATSRPASEGDELTVEFTVLGTSFVGLNGGPQFKPNQAVSFMVVTDDQDETDRYWDAIVGNGGTENDAAGARTAGASPGRSRHGSSWKGWPIRTGPPRSGCSRR